MYDIIIVGAGPAGLTAAIYARRASKKVLVLSAKNVTWLYFSRVVAKNTKPSACWPK